MYSIYDYAYNGLLYLNNILRPRYKRLSQLMIYTTTDCQSRCKHCNIWQKPVEHLSLNDIKRIMQSRCVTKQTTVGLEGGEFILHPKASEILAWFHEHHQNYTLLSNCLNPHRVIEAVRHYQPRHLYASLDGDSETYKRMRGCNGYERVIQVVEALKDEVPISLMFCLSPWNTFDDMAYVIDIAKFYGIDVRIGIYGTMAFFDTKSELLKASSFVKQIPKSIHDTQENYDFVALYDEWKNGNLRLRCHSIRSCLVVHSNGDVPLCNHSLTNLYPVFYYLGVPLKYICITSTRKAKLIEQKFPNVKATVSLDVILQDKVVDAVFVSTSPKAHFSIASEILQSRKSLFIEKPPCQTLEELDTLIETQRIYGTSVAMVGWQKRYAPAIQVLKKRLCKEHLISYDLHYLTGAFPEGNALLELYIHSLDLVCFLFGKPKLLTVRQVVKDSYILMLQHNHIVGTLELSTSYTWHSATETLKVNTKSGCYQMREMEELTFEPSSLSIFGIPTEKIHKKNKTIEYLFHSNQFSPIIENNLVYTQGFYREIESFVNLVEKGKNDASMELNSTRDTYDLLRVLQCGI